MAIVYNELMTSVYAFIIVLYVCIDMDFTYTYMMYKIFMKILC